MIANLQAAKMVGDLFNGSLYTMHIKLHGTPFMEWKSPEEMDKLVAEDVMSSKLTYLYPITRVRSIEQILHSTTHGAFPIITPIPKAQHTSSEHEGGNSRNNTELQDLVLGNSTDADECGQKLVFEGLILRHQLVTLLKNRCFFNEADGVSLMQEHFILAILCSLTQPKSQDKVSHAKLTAEYPRYSESLELTELTETERNMLMVCASGVCMCACVHASMCMHVCVCVCLSSESR